MSKYSEKDYKILFLGDMSFGESYPKKPQEDVLKQHGYDHFFRNFEALLSEAHLRIVNLETSLNELKTSPFKGKKAYLHQDSPKHTPIYLKKYDLDVVSLANNHSFDYSNQGLENSFDVLKRNNIQYFGAGKNSKEAKKPYIKSIQFSDENSTKKINLYVIAAYEYKKTADTRYQCYASRNEIGINPLKVRKISEQIQEIKKKDPDSYVIMFPHWGRNYTWASDKQREKARKLIDAGADLIIGHGAHMIQEIESYKNSWIIHSLGNFIFNSPGRYEKMKAPPYSFMAMLNLHIKNNRIMSKINLYPIVTDNQKTNYSPRFVNPEEFNEVVHLIKQRNNNANQIHISSDNDANGLYLSLTS